MTSNIVHLEPDPHVAVQQLLPWFINGRLDAAEREQVEEHLAGCAACRAEFEAEVTSDIRPDTLFAPFHWGGKEAANALISGTLDPTSRMPEFKLAAVRLVAAGRLIPSPSMGEG